MITAILNIRLRQVSRTATGLGLARVLFLAGFSVFMAFVLFLQTAGYPNALYSTAVCLAIIAFIQVKRSDRIFLKIHFSAFKFIFLDRKSTRLNSSY